MMPEIRMFAKENGQMQDVIAPSYDNLDRQSCQR